MFCSVVQCVAMWFSMVLFVAMVNLPTLPLCWVLFKPRANIHLKIEAEDLEKHFDEKQKVRHTRCGGESILRIGGEARAVECNDNA